jgi:glycosyltransferase involved in cell wall biosynthesis
MTCHLVYTVPLKGYAGRASHRICRFLQKSGLPVSFFGSRKNPDMDWWPKQSPFENTKHIFHGLSSHMPTLLYSFNEQLRCRFKSDDIFLGHPYFPFRSGEQGVTELSLGQSVRPRVFGLISPLHCDTDIETIHINKAYLDAIDRLLPRADILFGIMGQYWWDLWPASPFAHWIPKMVRLDMAIDTKHFPRVKTGFNPPGKRRFLYIGKNDPMKGVDFLSRLFSREDGFSCGWIGRGSEIAGVSRISTVRPLTGEFMKKIARDFDFFVSPSRADPNPTTILESMAWGFPVVCTPQSGYYETEYMRNIFRDDEDRSVEVLRDLQYADEAELMNIADKARETVERQYTWERFVGTIRKKLDIT